MVAPKRYQVPCAQKYSVVIRGNNGSKKYPVQGNFRLVCEFLQHMQYPGVEPVSLHRPFTLDVNVRHSVSIPIPTSTSRITRVIKAM